MNVCMFTNTYLPHVGGVARSVSRFAQDLNALGHKVLVVAPEFPGEQGSEDNGVEVLRVPAIQNFNGSDFSVRIPMPFVIDKRIDDFYPEVIHSHHPFLLGDAALRVARKRQLPLVFTHHTLYEKYTHYVPLDSEAMQRFAVLLSTEYANLCTGVITPSLSVRRLIRKRGVITPIEEIPTGVDTQFFGAGRGAVARKAHGIAPDAPVIGHVGRLAPEKNLAYLAEAVALFFETHRDACFLIAGRGPSKTEIHRVFADKGQNDQVRMLGTLSGQDLADAYAAMDVFVFSSKSETQGMVLTEAMAARTPVIALDASGAREVVKDGKNGRLLPGTASPRTFAEAIGEFFQDPIRQKAWCKEALKTAQRFSRQTTAEKLLHFYESVTGAGVWEKAKDNNELLPWNALLQRLKTEWDLLSEKTRAAAGIITEEEKTEVRLE